MFNFLYLFIKSPYVKMAEEIFIIFNLEDIDIHNNKLTSQEQIFLFEYVIRKWANYSDIYRDIDGYFASVINLEDETLLYEMRKLQHNWISIKNIFVEYNNRLINIFEKNTMTLIELINSAINVWAIKRWIDINYLKEINEEDVKKALWI